MTAAARLPFDPADAGLGPGYDPTRDPVNDAPPAANAANHDATSADATEDAPRRDIPLPDQAWQRFCHGESYAAIARALGLDRHTVARYIKQIHDETQSDRHAERTLALTQALGALHALQAAAWTQLELDQGHERIVWDLFLRAAANAAAQGGGLHAGNTVHPPTFRPQTARLLTLILNAVRQIARLEFLDDPTAPTRQGDVPEDEPRDQFLYTMMRRSDQEELERLRQQRSAPAADGAPNHEDDPDVPSVSSVVPLDAGTPAVAAPPFQPHDADGNPPIPHPHPKPDLRPDGTDDWFVYRRTPLTPPANLPQLPGAPTLRRRRPWDRRW